MMTDEVKAYFFEQYRKAKFCVVPGHWSEFESKEEVDKWLKNESMICDTFIRAFSKNKDRLVTMIFKNEIACFANAFAILITV